MKLGFLTACLPELSLEQIVLWAKENGFEMLEVASWPASHGRDYAGTHLDAGSLNEEKAKDIKLLFEKNGMGISSLAYYDNNLHPDQKKRKSIQDHLKKVISAAALLGCDLVGTFVGRDPGKNVRQNLEEYKKIFPGLVEYAQKKKVRLMIEHCPMEGWQVETLPGTISYSPELWQKMFEIVPSKNFGLNFDPSHLYWLGVDYLKAVREFGSRIFHAHAKDTEILGEALYRESIYGKNWHRARMPGLGEINWARFVSALQEAGYNETLSIEHEDPVWSGSEEKIKKGLILAARHLNPLLI